MGENLSSNDIVALASKIVSSYVENHEVEVAALPELIREVHTSLRKVAHGKPWESAGRSRPAVPIKSSVTRDYIICLEDGAKLKMLKRHLRARFGMTPEQYRAKWRLPANYPMVAPAYAERRSELARQIGLGARRAGKGKRGSTSRMAA